MPDDKALTPSELEVLRRAPGEANPAVWIPRLLDALAEATQRAERAERDADDWQYLAELNYEGAADMVNLQAVRERNEILARERALRTALEKAEWYEWYEFNDFAESPSEKALLVENQKQGNMRNKTTLLFHQCPSCDGVKERNGHEEGCNTASALAATPAAAPEVKQGKVIFRGKAVPKPGLPEEPSLS